MADEPSLPTLPAVSWDERSQTFSNARKRVHDRPSLSLNSSSDPATFSSDDDPGLDNYAEGRRKKRYVGSWFQQHPAPSDSSLDEAMTAPTRPKRTLARQVDSGVFLENDGAESEDMMEAPDVPLPSRLPQLEKRGASRVSPAELAARERIRACVEHGNESLDLWSLGIDEISNETVAPLSTFSCIPHVAKGVAFEQKEPELKVYLAMNRLTRIPGALLDVAHLTVLSLRGNKLTELPPAMGKLCSLKELNVSQNRLKYLPAQLLDLLQPTSNLRDLVLHPNPLYKPDNPFPCAGASEDEVAEDETSKCAPHFVTRYLGRSPLQLSDSRGQMLSPFRLPSGEMAQSVAVDQPGKVLGGSGVGTDADADADAARPSAVPSLIEAALRSCYASAHLADLGQYMPDGPPQLRQLLDRAARQKESGGLACSRCRRLLIVPPVEWVAWREIRTRKAAREPSQASPRRVALRLLSLAEDERAVPFLHRACGWRCGPAQ